MSGMWAQVRIYALPEVVEIAGEGAAAPASVLDARFQVGLRYACAWVRNPNVTCALCGEPLGGHASYLAVLMPVEVELGFGTSSGVCVECGKAPRTEVLTGVERSALLMFGPEAGHA